MKAQFNQLLEDQKTKVKKLEVKVSSAKASYAEALHNLEQISDEIHRVSAFIKKYPILCPDYQTDCTAKLRVCTLMRLTPNTRAFFSNVVICAGCFKHPTKMCLYKINIRPYNFEQKYFYFS